ncbi:hypothetical protein GQ55_2G404500 [Panicum hallii var. hallii]|uniref:Uncharacterized protein n=1 Tax=Panicum hallii var. hallii TaxID=1504633 RepID=A0A2T7EXL0_9POAL|nr:hypothetical protein GQ55_2G404500 [Panicum hallii var. hallii]
MLAPSRSSWTRAAAGQRAVIRSRGGTEIHGAGRSRSTIKNRYGHGRRRAPARLGALRRPPARAVPPTARRRRSGGPNGGGGDENRKRMSQLSTYLNLSLLGNIRITPTHTGTNS